LATKSAEILALRPVTETISQTEQEPPRAALLRIASLAKFEPLRTRWSRIVSGVVAVFALLIGANYWVSERGPASDASRAAIEPPPMDGPAPHNNFSLLPNSRQPEPEGVRAPTAAQPQISVLDQPREPVPGQPPQPALGHEPRYTTVSEGQSLVRIAHANHVSAKAVAVATR
jgi:hypothetical protein